MPSYPVTINVSEYKGKDPRKNIQYHAKLEIASGIQNFLNSQMRNSSETKTFTNYDIASALNVSEDSVAEIISYNFGPSNGVTIASENNSPKE